MGIKKGQRIELVIDDIAIGGRGLAKVDGMVVFVDQAVPGDRVWARIYRKKKRHAEARIDTLVEASSMRIDAPCPYSGVCGGCKWQYFDYNQQLEYKRQHVAQALAHIGGIRDVVVHPTIPSELQFGYRNKMEFSCADRRWLMPHEMGREDLDTTFALGLHVPGTFYKVLDIEACLLQPSMGNRIMSAVRDYIRASDRPVYGLRSHEGFWRFLMLRHSAALDCWMVNLITASEDRAAVAPLASHLRQTFPNITSVVNNITARKAGVALGEYEILLAGAATIQDRINNLTFEISANSFFQTNTRGAERLYGIAQQYASLTGGEKVLDLYCGTGTIAICLADQAHEVVGFEIAPSAIADARNNCRLNRITNCRFIEGDLRHRLQDYTTPVDVIVIDPPRAGMHKDVVAQILRLHAARLVYVSCNPATLARDLGLLQEAYRIVEVQPVDMFPHTFHVEAVAKLEPR